MIALAVQLAVPILLAGAIGLLAGLAGLAGAAGVARPLGRPVLAVAALALIAAGAAVSALQLVPGRDGLRLDIGVMLAAAYAAGCLAAALARRGLALILSGRRRA